MSNRRKKRIQAYAKAHGISYQTALQRLAERKPKGLKVVQAAELPDPPVAHGRSVGLLLEAVDILRHGDSGAVERAAWRIEDALRDLGDPDDPLPARERAYRRGVHQAIAWMVGRWPDDGAKPILQKLQDAPRQVERLAREMRSERTQLLNFLDEMGERLRRKVK